MFNEKNVRDSLYEEYFHLALVGRSRGKAIDKLYTVNDVLTNINFYIDTYNKDELIVVKNILSMAKQIIINTSRYQIIARTYKEKNKELYAEVYEKYKSLSKS